MCICGWQLVAVAVLIPCLSIVYGELIKRSTGTASSDVPARHCGGESVTSLRKRHRADDLPYYPSPVKPIGS